MAAEDEGEEALPDYMTSFKKKVGGEVRKRERKPDKAFDGCFLRRHYPDRFYEILLSQSQPPGGTPTRKL